MRRQRGCSAIIGLILVLLGLWLLGRQFFPELDVWIHFEFAWPVLVIGVGVFLLLLGLLSGAPGMAVPATIVGGIGLMLYWQNATGNWTSWVYTWTLIPGFIGLGILLSGLLGGHLRQSLSGGLFMVVLSLVLFTFFGSLLGGANILGPYWPVLLILLGLWMLARMQLRTR